MRTYQKCKINIRVILVNKQLAQTAVGTGAGTLVYTCPTGYTSDIKDINIANTGAAAINFDLNIVAFGGSVTTANRIFPTVAIPPYTMIQWEGIQSLKAGGFLQCIGSIAGITVTITGEEFRVAA